MLKRLISFGKGIVIVPYRESNSILNSLSAESLWKGVTSVSNAGKKRGRARSVMRAKDLNRGQIIGTGKANIIWPGLNAPVIQGKELVQRVQLPPDPDREKKLNEIRDSSNKFKALKLKPLERGWSGHRLPGRKLGSPDPINGETFDGFETIVLEYKSVAHMTGNLGRRRSQSALVVTGNGKGVIGIGAAKGPDGRTAIRKAKNCAGQKLLYFDLYDGHTVNHDFHAQFRAVKLSVKKKPPGYGLNCHRSLKAVCQMIGIKDIFIYPHGSTNVLGMVRAFLHGLEYQETHQQMADKLGYHVIELREDTNYLPKLIAAPTTDVVPQLPPPSYEEYINKGLVEKEKGVKLPFWTRADDWDHIIMRNERFRNQPFVRCRILADYGKLSSYHHLRKQENPDNFKIEASKTFKEIFRKKLI